MGMADPIPHTATFSPVYHLVRCADAELNCMFCLDPHPLWETTYRLHGRRLTAGLCDNCLSSFKTVGPTPLRQARACQGCLEQAECEYRDSTAVNAMSPDGNGAWLCDECDENARNAP
jgi:hypothetical protein